MKKLFWSIIPLMLVFFAVSCTSDELCETVSEGKISFEIPAFKTENGVETRTSFASSTKYTTWGSNEQIGVKPETPNGYVLPFTISNNMQSRPYSIHAGYVYDMSNEDWNFKEGQCYTAFYPYKNIGDQYDFDIDLSKRSIVMAGTSPTINIGSFDYMYGETPCYSSHTPFDFEMIRLYGLLGIKISGMTRNTWKKITLSTKNGEKSLAVFGTFYFSSCEVRDLEKTSSITLLNSTGKSLSTSFSIHFPLFECTTGDLVLSLEDKDGVVYTANLKGKNVEKGYYYEWVLKGSDLHNENEHDFVDLGLPSGLKWATMNVGAKSVTDYGTYFAWGEVTGCERNADGTIKPAIMDGYPNTWTGGKNSNYVNGFLKSDYGFFGSCTTYKWATIDSYDAILKYSIDLDRKFVLDPEDDAATVNWGKDWRMPTYANMLELVDNCYCAWTSNYNGTGVPGCIVFKALRESDKGVQTLNNSSLRSGYTLSVNHIFLPAAGGRDGQKGYEFGGAGHLGCYWTSSLAAEGHFRVQELYFAVEFFYKTASNYRFNAQPVRAVRR